MSTADFIERRWRRDFPSLAEAQSSIVIELRERGATFFRISLQHYSGQVVGEGWREPPKDQGDEPL